MSFSGIISSSYLIRLNCETISEASPALKFKFNWQSPLGNLSTGAKGAIGLDLHRLICHSS